ncbi:MAG: glycoside hydrolase family 3 N-terminal domain-containing protein, partial [Pseudomonadota bacterium]
RLSDLPMAMTAHVVYDAIDPENPATTSQTIIDMIRDDFGFDGLLMTDDLSMKALDGDFGSRTMASLEAGCDLILHCNGDMEEMRQIADRAGSLSGKPLARAHAALDMRKSPEPFDMDFAVNKLKTFGL